MCCSLKKWKLICLINFSNLSWLRLSLWGQTPMSDASKLLWGLKASFLLRKFDTVTSGVYDSLQAHRLIDKTSRRSQMLVSSKSCYETEIFIECTVLGCLHPCLTCLVEEFPVLTLSLSVPVLVVPVLLSSISHACRRSYFCLPLYLVGCTPSTFYVCLSTEMGSKIIDQNNFTTFCITSLHLTLCEF